MLDFWKKGFVMRGVATRKEFWLSYLVWLAIPSLLLTLLTHQFDLIGTDTNTGVVVIMWCLIVYMFTALVPSITLSVRRFHDIGKPGTYYLINFIPYLGTLIFLAYMLTPSKKNSYIM